MGADLWQYDVPGQTEPHAAFEAIQARVFDEFTQRHKIDFPKMVREAVAGRREEIAGARAEGDPYGLADSYEESLAELESLCSQPLPVDKPGQIELFRKIWYAMALGEPIGNLLDTVGITRAARRSLLVPRAERGRNAAIRRQRQADDRAVEESVLHGLRHLGSGARAFVGPTTTTQVTASAITLSAPVSTDHESGAQLGLSGDVDLRRVGLGLTESWALKGPHSKAQGGGRRSPGIQGQFPARKAL